jgi:conjugal transfer pilus assembly protein TraE
MEQEVFIAKYKSMYKQRNFFLVGTSLLLISNVLLGIMAFGSSTQMVLVPGISEKLEISSKGVSESYLRRGAHMFLSLLLDLSPSDIEFKRDAVLKLTTSKSYNDVAEYFEKQVEKMKQFKVSTYFTPKEMLIDVANMKVTTKGIFTSRFGLDGQDEKEMTFVIVFTYEHGFLLVKKFGQEISK